MTEKDSSGKWILDSARIELNADYVLPGVDALPIVTHEMGHSCGLHSHNKADVSVMRIRPNGQHHLTLHDAQMLDRWNPYPVVYSPDGTLTCWAVAMPTGTVDFFRFAPFIDLRFPLMKAWRIIEGFSYKGPVTDNVTIGENTELGGEPAQIVRMKHVLHMDGGYEGRVLFTKRQLISQECGDSLWLIGNCRLSERLASFAAKIYRETC